MPYQGQPILKPASLYGVYRESLISLPSAFGGNDADDYRTNSTISGWPRQPNHLRDLFAYPEGSIRTDNWDEHYRGKAGQFFDTPLGAGYAAAVLADNPIAYWRLDDTGTTAADLTGHGHTGTLSATGVSVNQPGAVSGDAAMVFDGVAGRITTGLAVAPHTIECFFRTSALGQTAAVSDLDGTGAFVGVSGGNLFIYYGGVGQISNAVPAANNQWRQAVWTYDGVAHRAYLDGATAGSVTSGVFGADNPLEIAHDASNATFFPGGVDEVAIYAGALSLAQIQTHYHAAGY